MKPGKKCGGVRSVLVPSARMLGCKQVRVINILLLTYACRVCHLKSSYNHAMSRQYKFPD